MPEDSRIDQRERRLEYRSYYLANRASKIAYAKSYRAKHPEKTKAAAAAWKAAHPEKRREYVRAASAKKRYGVTRQQQIAMFEAQRGMCAICGIEQSKLKRSLCIDHDHNTGIVRGLICHPCNTVLGHARDNTSVLVAAIAYLEKSRT